jgi:RNA-directed DNA polymerase
MTTPYLTELIKISKNQAYIKEVTLKARPLVNKNLPPILSLKHLCELSGSHYLNLYKYTFSNRKDLDYYKVFSIKKRSGGKRWIVVPSENLDNVQKYINEEILNSEYAINSLHNSATAYIKGRSHITNAQQHLYSDDIIKVDIVRFFESISERQVFHVFQSFGYSRYVSFILARLCTRVIPAYWDVRYQKSARWHSDNKLYKLNYPHSKFNGKVALGHLPQGCSTSPMLANLVCREMDTKIEEYAKINNLVYTRYADDITLSGTINNLNETLEQLYDILKRQGFSPNLTKTKFVRKGQLKIVTGLSVTDSLLRIPKKYKDKVKQELYYIEKFGPEAHCNKIGCSNILTYFLHLEGKINFIKQVEQEIGNKFSLKLNELVPELTLYKAINSE